MEQLIAMLNAIAPMSAALEAYLKQILDPWIYRKGEIILGAGQICDRIFFIEKGMVRSHYITEKGEVTHWIMKEGDICTAVLSFLRQIPSFETHIAYEACRCWGVTKAQLEHLYFKYPEFNLHGRIVTGEYHCQNEERLRDLRLQPKEAKYEKLMQYYPELARRVKQKHLASLLGVSKRTFDNMRSDYLARQNETKTSSLTLDGNKSAILRF